VSEMRVEIERKKKREGEGERVYRIRAASE
jgi:hypothetical protein